MFESDIETTGSGRVSRRLFLATIAGAATGAALWSIRKPRVLEVQAAPGLPREVTIVEFSDDGHRLKKVKIAKVVKTDEEWQKQLSSNAFAITRHADTELAFSGQYWNLHEKGLYRCICCDNALFSSDTKFESGTGWPSFWAPIAKENVTTETDYKIGVPRSAVSCTECDAHLGHVFDDGPQPTGLRYCMNSGSLKFVKKG